MTRKQTSISDIARDCGVSAMTVSRVLRQGGNVRQKTRERVLASAEKLGYMRGSRLGRPEAVPEKHGRKVLLICGSTGRNVPVFHSRLLTALEQRLTARDCECVLFSSDGNYRGFLRLLESAKRASAGAVLIVGDFPAEQLNALLFAFPGAVLLDNPGPAGSDAIFSSFAFDNAAAARLGTAHLLDTGRRRIALVNGIKGHFFSEEFERGFRETLLAHGFAPEETRIVNTDFTPAGAARATAGLIGSGIPFDAILTNDEMASGAYRELAAAGWKIPQDAAVCGCDNLPLGEMLYPSLTTIRLDYDELAANAVEFAAGKHARTGTPFRVRLMPVLLPRESTLSGDSVP